MSSSSAAFVTPSAFRTANPHRAVPAGGSYRCERTGLPAVLTDEGCYPVAAECAVCRRPIRLDQLIQMEWNHVRAAAAVPQAPVNPGRGEPGAGEHPPAPGAAPAGEG